MEILNMLILINNVRYLMRCTYRNRNILLMHNNTKGLFVSVQTICGYSKYRKNQNPYRLYLPTGYTAMGYSVVNAWFVLLAHMCAPLTMKRKSQKWLNTLRCL